MSATLSAVPAAPPRPARLARVAVAALFLTNGALFANVVPRYPQIKADLGVSNAVLGTALAAMPLGALLAGLFAATVIRRFRSGPVAAIGIVALAASTLALPFAPVWGAFAVLMCVVGALDAIVDVAQNSHGLRVQRVYGRSIVNSFHGLWSIGAVLGGLMGSAAAGLDVPLALHLTISAIIFSTVALVALRYLLPGPDTTERTPSPAAAVPSTPAEVPAARSALTGSDEVPAAPSAPAVRSDVSASSALEASGDVSTAPSARGEGPATPSALAPHDHLSGAPSGDAPTVRSGDATAFVGADERHPSTEANGRDSSVDVDGRRPSASVDGGSGAVTVGDLSAGPGRGRGAVGHAMRMVVALGLLAACGALVEDAGSSWGALYLTGLGAGAATAGLAFVALQTAMTIGRLTGDRVVDRFGQRTVARTGGALAAVGMGLALALPSIPTTLVGFALAGLGFATLIPAAMHTADELPGLSPGTGLTIVSWLLRGGFLLSPPLVGLIADNSSLRVGLLTVVAAGCITVAGARVLLNRTP